jgi:hypothetical protein
MIGLGNRLRSPGEPSPDSRREVIANSVGVAVAAAANRLVTQLGMLLPKVSKGERIQ